jgi:hypothetical protein
MLANGVTKSVIGLLGAGGPLFENVGNCGLEEIFCLKLSTKLGFDRPFESPSTGESVFDEALNLSGLVSPECSGAGTGVRVGVGAGVGIGTGAGSGTGV